MALHPAAHAQEPSRAASTASVRTALVRIARIEDGRGTQGRDPADLSSFLDHVDPTVRGAALRALGRHQRPELLSRIYPTLRDQSPAVRQAAINAVGQALQGLRGQPGTRAATWLNEAIDSLGRVARAASAGDATAGMVARTLGRLPWTDSASARRVESLIVELATRGRATGGAVAGVAPARLEGALHGLYAVARQRRALGTPSPVAVALWRDVQAYRVRTGGEPAARARRLAILGLTAAGAMDVDLIRATTADPDEQVRRLGVVATAVIRDTGLRRALVSAALRDPSPLVRLEGVRAARALVASFGCAPLIDATGDANAHVVLAAIDGMSSACRDREAVTNALLGLVDANRSDSPSRARGRSGWHVHAHALVALARTDPDRAATIVRRDARESTLWTVRVYAARAAAQLRDTATLRQLAVDRDGNVQVAALGGLAAVAGHTGDDLAIVALGAPGYHVVLEAAQALKGSPGPDAAAPALAEALERLTAQRRENTRDARLALLDRLDDLGSVRLAPRLEPLRSDIDSAVARRAAAVLARWTGREVVVTTAPLALPDEDLEPLMSGVWRARVVMSPSTGGGTFEVALFPREAPFTVARFVRLARAGHYNGLTFHRVEPGFVIQGGSPAATEYVGDGPFMRDELDVRSHTRGTLGISTRGRDTGDAQIFVNLVDNFRLDHDYTVFGEIVRGRALAEGVLEADVIERIEIVRAR